MLRSKCCWILVLMLVLLTFTASAEEIEYRPQTYIAFSEPYGYQLVNVGPGCTAQIGQHTYYFLTSTGEDKRDAIIAQTEAAFTALQAWGAHDRAYTIHVVKGSYEPRVEGDTLYLGTTAYNTASYITGMAKLVFGNRVNYGLIYGVSCEAAAALGVAVDDPIPLHDALSVMTGGNRAYLDLSYACFIEPYADAAMQANVQSIARSLTASMSAQEKSVLLRDYSDEAFYARLNAFLAANGQEAYENADMWGISFHGGGRDVRLRWETENASYVVDNGFEDFDLEHIRQYIGEQNPLNDAYPQLRRSILSFETVITYTQEYFAPYQISAPPTIWFENNNVNYKSGYNRLLWAAFYDPANHTIHLGAVDSLGHEYAHAIMEPTDSMLAIEECLTYYYGYFGTPNGLIATFPMMADAVAGNDNENFLALVDQMSVLIGHEVDFHNPADYIAVTEAELVHAGGASWHILSENAFTTAATGLDTGARFCFAHHLLTIYGKDLTIRAIAENDPETLLGKSWDALVTDWSTHLNDTYGHLFAK